MANRALTRDQSKQVYETERIAFYSDGDASTFIADPRLNCELMARDVFDIVKCMLYSRSASSTCRTCTTRFPAESIFDTIWSVRGSKMATVGACSKCLQTKTLVAADKCHRCNYGDWKNLSSAEVRRLIASGEVKLRKSPKSKATAGPGPISAIAAKGFQPHSHRESKPIEPQEKQRMLAGALESGIVLEFKNDQNLFLRICESAKRNRRPVGSETLYLLEQAMDRGISSTSVSIDAVIKIVGKVKNYPIPEGSPKDVFAKALDILILRLQELKE